jgi:hypothetical protein
MIPCVIVLAEKTLRKTATVAAKKLREKYPGHALSFEDSLLAKVGNYGSGLGVFFL